MICKQCGTEVPDNYKFCTKCGNDLDKQREEEQAAQAANSAGDSLHCPKCGAPIHAGDKFCTGCGADLSIKETASPEPSEPENIPDEFHCPHCGAEIKPGDKFCIVCGKPLLAEEPAQLETPVQPQAPEQAAQAQPVSAQQQVQPQAPTQWQAQAQAGSAQQQYNQQQYAQQPNTFYAQTQPQYQQAPTAQAKKPKSKTPAWVWVLIALLAAAIIFCIVWFFVLPDRHNTTDNSAVSSSQTQVADGQVGSAGDNAPARVYVDENSEWAGDAESELGDLAVSTISKAKGWRNKNLMGEVTPLDYYWNGNTLTVIVGVSINENAATNVESFYYDYYYTYVKYKDVYREGNSYHCKGKPETPSGKKLNLYDSSGSRHMVAGYATEEEAISAAGV